MNGHDILLDRSTVVIITYAPAGLGHLRVSNALYEGLSREITPILLGAEDKLIMALHRMMSTIPFFKKLMEWTQSGKPEDVFTNRYRKVLRKENKQLKDRVISILDERIEVPSKILIVATHFALAHRLASIKDEISNAKHVQIKLVVVVTDDSPQKLWYVPGSDLTFVPSHTTKDALMEYGRKAGLPMVRFQVNPYPVSPILSKLLSADKQKERMDQLDPVKKNPIHVAIPISGAAVGTGFTRNLIDEMVKRNPLMKFHVIAKTSPYTKPFLDQIMDLSYIQIYTAHHDRQIVSAYNDLYQNQVIALEVTKPSEQSFKGLLCPSDVGGSVILFSQPVGRQEYDNLNFLKKHRLIPLDTEEKMLFDRFMSGQSLTEEEKKIYAVDARTWRGIRLPSNPETAAGYVSFLLREGILKIMADASNPCSYYHGSHDELGGDGVEKFWNIVRQLIA